jgi:hypothetical protein
LVLLLKVAQPAVAEMPMTPTREVASCDDIRTRSASATHGGLTCGAAAT